MLFKLEVKDRHTGCTRCNYAGCSWERDRHPKLGHWIWMFKKLSKDYNPVRMYRRWVYKLTDFNYKLIDNVEVDGIDTRDYPDFSDAFIAYAEYKGKPMTDAQLDRLNDNSDFVYGCVQERLY